MGGVRNIMVRAGADFTQLSSAFQRASSEAEGFGSRMENVLSRVGFVGEGLKTIFEGAVHAVEGIGEFAQQAGELDGRLSSLNSRLGDSANQFMQWGDTVGKQAGLSKAFMIEEGASLTAMLESQATSQQDLANKSEKLMKNIAIISSATGRDIKTVSEAVTSALAGHTNALNAYDFKLQVSSLRSTQAYKQIAGNAPWAKLTQQQKEAIMYTEINAQTLQLFGANVVEDTATRMNRFTSALSDVKTNLEQAFQPVLYAVLPILTTLINYINTALQYVTAFFQVLFGYSGAKVKGNTDAINSQANAVGNLASAHQKLNSATGGGKKKTSSGGGGISVPKVGSGNHALKGNGAGTVGGGKKLGTGFVASFDQVHTVPEASSTGGSGSGKSGGVGSVGGGGAGGGVGAGGMPDIGGGMVQGANMAGNAMTALQNKVSGVVNAIKAWWEPFGAFFKGIWDKIVSYFQGVVTGLVSFWNQHGAMFVQAMVNIWNMIKPIIMFLAKFIWDSIKGAIDGVILFFEGLMEFISGIFTGHWKEAFDGLWKMIVGFVEGAWNIFNLTLFGGIKSLLLDLIVKGAEAFLKLADVFKKPLGDFFIWLVKGASDGIKGTISFFSDFGSWLESNAVAWAHAFDNFFSRIVNAGWGAINGLKSIFGGLYDWLMRSLVYPITNAFNQVANGVGGGIMGGLKAVWNQIADTMNAGIGFINGALGVVHAPQIGYRLPHLAKGGITNGQMTAVIGDNAGGREVVTPLDRLQGMMASTVAQTIQTVMAMQGNSKGVGGDIVLNVDGKTFARIVKPYLDNEQKRVGTNVRLNTI